MCVISGGLLGGEDSSCPSVESLVNWLLEHDDTVLEDLSDDSDVFLSYFDDIWSDQESELVDDNIADDEVDELLFNIIVIIIIVIVDKHFYCAHYKKNACTLQLSVVDAKVKS